MTEKKLYQLQIDSDFRDIICPMTQAERLQLEDNILTDGCREPLIVWNGTIIDGHNRYEICHRHKIPFAIREIQFDYKEAAIAWICANQLGRRNLTEETRKFLIGMQYESEKVANTMRNAQGINQYTEIENPKHSKPGSIRHITALRVAEEHALSHATVQKYGAFTRAVSEIQKKAPDIATNILSGRYKISHQNIITLSQMSPENMQKVGQRLEEERENFTHYNTTRREIQFNNTLDVGPSGPSVKDMPAFDPDAEITGLVLTMPSWTRSIDRVRKNTDFPSTTSQAKEKLKNVLGELYKSMIAILKAMEE